MLDYGCGTGTITLRIAKQAAKVHGVDVSEGMLKRVQQNLKDQHIDNTTFCKISRLEDMFQTESFDVITCLKVLQYIENEMKNIGFAIAESFNLSNLPEQFIVARKK